MLQTSGLFTAGNISHYFSSWEKLTSDSVILNIVQGYELEFDTLPLQTTIPKPINFNHREMAIIDEQIDLLLDKGVIIPSGHEVGH